MAAKQAAATAEYIHAQLRGLALMARESGLDILGYLVEVAALEAANQAAIRPRGK